AGGENVEELAPLLGLHLGEERFREQVEELRDGEDPLREGPVRVEELLREQLGDDRELGAAVAARLVPANRLLVGRERQDAPELARERLERAPLARDDGAVARREPLAREVAADPRARVLLVARDDREGEQPASERL